MNDRFYNDKFYGPYDADQAEQDLGIWLDDNGHKAIELLRDLTCLLPPPDADEDSEAWQTYDNKQVNIIIDDKQYTFINSPALFQALEFFANDILDEQ